MRRKKAKEPYRTYAVDSDGKRTRLRATAIVVMLAPDVEVEIELVPTRPGHIRLCTPSVRRIRELFKKGIVNDFQVVYGGANALEIRANRGRTIEAATEAADGPGDELARGS